MALSVMMLRIKDKERIRPFKTPTIWLIGPLAMGGCIILFLFLPLDAKLVFPIWTAIGLIFIFCMATIRATFCWGLIPPRVERIGLSQSDLWWIVKRKMEQGKIIPCHNTGAQPDIRREKQQITL